MPNDKDELLTFKGQECNQGTDDLLKRYSETLRLNALLIEENKKLRGVIEADSKEIDTLKV